LQFFFLKHLIFGILQQFQPAYKKAKWVNDIYDALMINNDCIKEMNLQKRFYKKLKIPKGGNLRMRQYRRIHYDYVPQRIEYFALTAKTHKIEYRYPLLDKRLIEFYLSLPPWIKAQKGYGRYILRKSMEGYLPPEIQWRTDKTGIVVPNMFLRWKRDEEALQNLIIRAKKSQIKHYIDYDKMLEMLEKIVNYNENSKERITPQAFQSAIMLLLYQLGD
jgi:asparagine synthase (glutamine-hydrolysing)